MVLDVNYDAKGDRTDNSQHTTEVSLVSIHQKSIFGTLGVVALIIFACVAAWVWHRKRITKHRRRHAALLAVTYAPGGQPQHHLQGGGNYHSQQQATTGLNHSHGMSLAQSTAPPSPRKAGFPPGCLPHQ